MKRYIIIALLFIACSSNEVGKDIPDFDSDLAYQYIIDLSLIHI